MASARSTNPRRQGPCGGYLPHILVFLIVVAVVAAAAYFLLPAMTSVSYGTDTASSTSMLEKIIPKKRGAQARPGYRRLPPPAACLGAGRNLVALVRRVHEGLCDPARRRWECDHHGRGEALVARMEGG